jgi:hypothetical protein
LRIDRVLRALLCEAAPLHAARARMREAQADWRADCAEVLGELERYGAGAPLGDCPELAALMDDRDRGLAFTASLVAAFVPVLAAEPFARMPFRQSSQGPFATLALAKCGRAMLSLATQVPGMTSAETMGFADGERYDLVLAGAGEGTFVRRGRDGMLDLESVVLAVGICIALNAASEALLVTRVRQGLVTLRLTRMAEAPQPSREYRLADGALVSQAAGDPRASRHELMLSVLGRMGRADAAPVFAEIAREGSEHLRWQALRECLALDTATGFRALCGVARDPADTLAPQAGTLRAQLLEAHPQLSGLEDQSCPA